MTEKGLEDTYMFEANDISMREYKLINKKLNRGYKVTSESMEQFGVWALPSQEYICLEPWQGIDDYVDQTTFDKKRGMMCIKVGETVRKSSCLEPLFEVQKIMTFNTPRIFVSDAFYIYQIQNV